MWTRRTFLSACSCCGGGLLMPAFAQTFDVSLSQGCFLKNDRAEDGYQDVVRGLTRGGFEQTTGDKKFDRLLGRAIIRLAGFFEEQPAFGIVDGAEHDNAFALPKEGPNAEFGTVGVGRTMLNKLRDQDETGMAILALIAHEFAHVAQFRRGTITELNEGRDNVKRSELHADYLTGCYLGWVKRTEPRVSVLNAGRFMESIGDTATHSKSHHGTPNERYQATEAGFELALADNLPFETYFKSGKAFILKTHA